MIDLLSGKFWTAPTSPEGTATCRSASHVTVHDGAVVVVLCHMSQGFLLASFPFVLVAPANSATRHPIPYGLGWYHFGGPISRCSCKCCRQNILCRGE